VAHEQARQAFAKEIEKLEELRDVQRAKSSISFAKWRVSKRLK